MLKIEYEYIINRLNQITSLISNSL